MSETILYLWVLCALCLGCKVKTKVSAAPAKVVEKVRPNILATQRIEVDSHGQAMDIDHDVVPDYRDHEKLTGNRCLPVDINGVGTCPEPSYCANLKGSKL